MARRLLIVLSLLSCALLATAVDASAAKRKARVAPAPTVTSVVPMKAQVGQKLTINGKHFLKGKGKTKVYFLREGGGVAWVPADNASSTRLIVTVPEKLIPLLRGTPQARVATKFQIRLLGKRVGSATKLAKSPVFTAPNATAPGDQPGPGGTPGPSTPPDGDCDGDTIKNSVDPDDDNDALTDDLETLPAHTDPCKADTDGDTVADGYEFYSAKDINGGALPYPGKKPWPNPLDSTDAKLDHDGDDLSMTDEFLLWKYYGNLSVPLNYSAGLQKSGNFPAPTENRLSYVDMDGDGLLSDDERDGDGDGLTNWDEADMGRMDQDWWDAMHDGKNNAPCEKETRYPLEYPGVAIFDPDSDGDGVKDGDDDQDHDGLSNAFEVARPGNWCSIWGLEYENSFPFTAPANPWARVQPYNPCKPVRSATCHLHPDFGYYGQTEVWWGINRSDAGPQPESPWDPAMYPNTQPG